MATLNTRNVHRSNMLMGFPYGTDFVYDDMVLTGLGENGEAAAKAVVAANSGKPGPGARRTDKGIAGVRQLRLLYVAIAPDGRSVGASVKGDRYSGYRSAAKIISEWAICLLRDAPDVP